MKWLPLIFLGCCVSSTVAAEMAYTVRESELKAKPFSDAAKLSSLPKDSKVEVIERKSGWMQVKVANKTGWVKMLNLRYDDSATPKKSGSSGFGSMFNLATTGKSGSTVTTGVRGLDEEDLKNPHPNPQALAELHKLAVNKNAAGSFGKTGSLAAKKIEYLSAPPAVKGE